MGETGATIELRLDSPDGDLIGTTALQSTGIEMRQGAYLALASMELKKTEGKRDLHFVAKGAPGTPGGGLMSITFNKNNPL